MLKKLTAVIFSLAVLAGCTANAGTEISETVSETAAAVYEAAETTTAATTTTVTTETSEETTAETEEVTEKAVDTSGVDYIKKELQSEWDNSEYNVSAVNLYAEDMNGDGIKELFVNYSFQALQNGITYIYDVSDGIKKLYEIPVRMWGDESKLYKDGDGAVHLIRKEGYAGVSGQCDLAYFDISYGSIKMPVYFKEYDWYDSGAHFFAYDLYKNCETVPLDFLDSFSGWRCFDPDKAEYIGRFDQEEINDAWYSGKKCKATDTAEKEIFDGMTYISDVKEIYSCSYKELKDFDGFWYGAAPVLAEIYGTKPVPQSMADLGVNPDGTLNDKFTERLKELATPDGPVAMGIFPALWDFDGDGIPEMILIFHTGGQGNMPCKVYDSESLEQIGEFKGFCRDGITRFCNNDEGTVIHNFYEHSNWQRVETVETVRMEQKKLVSQSELVRQWSNNEEYNPRLEYRAGGSTAKERGYDKMTAENYHYIGNACTSYHFCSGQDDNIYGDINGSAEIAVESYNNYIKAQTLIKSDLDKLLVFGHKNEYAVLQTDEGCFFIDEKGERTLLKEGRKYYKLYTLWDDIIVCQPSGITDPCDVYIMTDGKPVLDEKISGYGMYLDYSHIYNGRFEITEGARDRYGDVGGVMGTVTSKKYQLYRDENGFHEYGSIVVPIEDFNKIYGETSQKIIESLGYNGLELYEVLYRSDCSFILKIRNPDNIEPISYEYYNITLKLTTDGELVKVYHDTGIYKTALIPEIAVYPEKMYTPENN